jgi:hypothetical protein
VIRFRFPEPVSCCGRWIGDQRPRFKIPQIALHSPDQDRTLHNDSDKGLSLISSGPFDSHLTVHGYFPPIAAQSTGGATGLAPTAELAGELRNLCTNVALCNAEWVLSQIKGLAETGEGSLP